MTDLVLEIFRAIIFAAIFVIAYLSGNKENIRLQKGWRYIMTGFALLLFGMVIDITDNFPSLNKYIIVGDTPYQSYLEKVVGYLFGLIMVALGFYKWVPIVVSSNKLQRVLKQYSDELEMNVTLRTNELNATVDQLRKEVSNRKKAELALRQSEELYSNIVESMNDGLIIVDRDLHITHWNRSMEEISKIPREEVFSRRKQPGEVSPQFLEGGLEKMAQKAMQGEMVQRDDVAYGFEAGYKSIFSEIFSPLRSDNGDIRGVVCIIRDITEKKRLESHLLQAQKMEAVGDLAGGIAHDFNNMLTSVLGHVALAKMTLKKEWGAWKELASAEIAIIRSSELSHKLVTFAKGGEPIKKKVPIADFLNKSLEFALSGTSIQLELFDPEAPLMVEIDENQMTQAIYNIVSNAREAMPQGGKIGIKIENYEAAEVNPFHLQAGEYAKISLSDQGPGIPQDQLEKIFNPYFSTKERGSQKGMGLGLSISHSIIKKHQGRLSVESVLGKGTMVYIYLPVLNAELEIANKEAQNEIREEWSGGLIAGKILIMDDEESLLDVAGKQLNFMGFETEFANNGDEAVQLYKEAIEAGRAFDAVILDLTVKGGMGGVDTIRKLFELDPGVAAIVSSGYSNDPVMVNYKEHGFCGAIIKPYTLADLKREISRLNCKKIKSK